MGNTQGFPSRKAYNVAHYPLSVLTVWIAVYHGKCSLIHSAGSFKTTEKTSDIIKGILKIPSVHVADIGMRRE